jgi:hypothetical protein
LGRAHHGFVAVDLDAQCRDRFGEIRGDFRDQFRVPQKAWWRFGIPEERERANRWIVKLTELNGTGPIIYVAAGAQ